MVQCGFIHFPPSNGSFGVEGTQPAATIETCTRVSFVRICEPVTLVLNHCYWFADTVREFGFLAGEESRRHQDACFLDEMLMSLPFDFWLRLLSTSKLCPTKAHAYNIQEAQARLAHRLRASLMSVGRRGSKSIS